MMTLNASVLIVLALTLMRRCAEGCVDTFPNLTDSSTECKNTKRTCSVTCKPGKIFYDGNYTMTYSCNEDNIWSPSVPKAGCKDKTQALYLIRLTVRYNSFEIATYCREAHDKALNDAIGNLTQQHLSFCMEYAGVGNISISSIMSTSKSFDIITVLEFKLVNSSTASFTACAAILRTEAMNFMTYVSPIICSSGITSRITIKDEIVDSYITSCQNHYVLVKDSYGRNYCVSDIPVVGVNSTSYLTQIHEDVVLHCEVQFGPVEYLYWQHDYLNITVDSNARYSGGTNDLPSLTIHNVTHEDTGYYTCNVVSQSGTGTSLFINLTVVGDGVDDQTTVELIPTSNNVLTDGITETFTDALIDGITETFSGVLTDGITETSTGVLTDGITETSNSDLKENDHTLYIAIGVGCGGLIIAIAVLVILIKRKTCSASPKRAYESTCNHEYSNEHFYAGLNDSTVSIATQQHNHTNENYINLYLRS